MNSDRGLNGRCPKCGVAFPAASKKANCVHLVWSKKQHGFVLRQSFGDSSCAQEDKYKINPLWRGSFRRAGERAQ